MSSNRGLTVVDVCRDLRIEPTPSLTWAVGAVVRDIYEQRYGCLPEKDLRNKTNGPGTHCFAIYPESMRAEIAAVIRHHQTEAQRQGELF
jgi:hypothetical protein